MRKAGRPAPGFVRDATPAQIAAFKTLPGGPDMIQAWRGRAARCVALAMERYSRIVGGLTPADRATFTAWTDGLPPRTAMVLTWRLGSLE